VLTRRRMLGIAGSVLLASSIPPMVGMLGAASDSVRPKIGGLTPNDEFYVTSYVETPRLDLASWRLRINGLVRRPIELDFKRLQSLPTVEETLTLECIGNPPDGSAIGNAQWVGVRLKPLLEKAGVNPKAQYAAMHAADGYYTGVTVDEIMRPENFLPYLMNGEPLPPAHGFPVRLFIPGKYGMKQPKWITEIHFVDRPFVGYWEARGWSQSAWRKVNSGFFSPRPPSSLISFLIPATNVATPVNLYGWALAGPSGIRKVEVSTDGGVNWHEARLLQNSSPYRWTVWQYRFAPASAGKYSVRVRATDGDGVTQPVSDPDTRAGMSAQPMMELDAITG
jgi:hypothetical protein